MTEQQACTLCGAGGHSAAQCNWNEAPLVAALQTIADFPCSAQDNMPAANMRLIASNALHDLRASQPDEQAEGALRCTCPSGNGLLQWPCPEHSGVVAPTYQFQSREIGESDWAPCDFSWYLYCSKSPEMDTRVVEETAQPSPAPELESQLLDVSAERNAMQRQRDAARGLLGRECDDADELIRLMGFDPEQYRTDGGSINLPKLRASVAQAGQAKKWTYASEQETNCAGCGVRKHTPLRVDWMGGYVCLTCIDEKLEEMYEALPDAQAGQVPSGWKWCLIPMEHTDEFNQACTAAFEEHQAGTGPCGVFIAGHRALLAAAPAQGGE